MKQQIAQSISDAIHAWRNGESLLLLEEPFADADIPRKIDNRHIGVRVTIAAHKRDSSLWHYLPSLFIQLEELAFESENQIDYIETVRVKAETKKDETIAVEIIEQTQKRETWVNGE